VQQQVAGYLENEISEKENPCHESVLLASDSQFLVHRQSREPDVVSVKHGNHEENEYERDNPSPQFADCPRLNIDRRHWRTGSPAHLKESLSPVSRTYSAEAVGTISPRFRKGLRHLVKNHQVVTVGC
jgi:hypothetical protein